MQLNYTWEEDNLQTGIKKRKKLKDTAFTITYPSDSIRDAKFQSSDQISTFLLRDALKIGYCKWQLFEKSIVDKGDYIKIIYKCRKNYCDATLIYHQKKLAPTIPPPTQKYYLTQQSLINKHRHVLRLTPLIASQQNIRQYLYDLPVEQKLQHHVENIKTKFNLTKCQARYLKERVFWKFKDQDHMLKKLTDRKVMFRRKVGAAGAAGARGKVESEILLIVTETMKRSYLYYGDTICFDITYKLLKKKRGQFKHLGVGFFVGQDQNTRIALFGLSTIEHETSQSFYTLFQFFFEVMQRIPETILTDDQKALGYAIQRMRVNKGYQYKHLLDWFHRCESLRRAIKKQPHNEEILILASRLLKEPSKMAYIDMMKEIASMINNASIMMDWIKDQSKYCLAFSPYKFIAFGIATSRAESFNNLIKRSVPHQTNIGRLIYFVMRVQKRLLNRTSTLNYIHPQILQHQTNPQLLQLSTLTQHLCFQQVRQYYEQSRSLTLLSHPTNPLTHTIVYYKYQRQYRFMVMWDIKYGCWRCQCGNNFRTGMACSHLVRVLREFGGCMGYYVNQRWLHCKGGVRNRVCSRPGIHTKRI